MKYFVLKTYRKFGNEYKQMYVTYNNNIKSSFGLVDYSVSSSLRIKAIKFVDDLLFSDALRIYMAYHDCEVEWVDIEKESNINVFHSIRDFGNTEFMKKYYDYQLEKYSHDYVIAPSEHEYLEGHYDDCLLYKILVKKENKEYWINDNWALEEDKNRSIILSGNCLCVMRLRMFLKGLNTYHCFYSVKLPCHYSTIYYSTEDIHAHFDGSGSGDYDYFYKMIRE